MPILPSNIEYATGNLLDADADALVNAVNTVGVMGKGIAVQFRQAFPANYAAYKTVCAQGGLSPGMMFITSTSALAPPYYIVNFPTKRDWRAKSTLEDIDAGLIALAEDVQAKNIRSIAVPALGCGNGGLDWDDVRPRIEATFAALPSVHVFLFIPVGTPAASTARSR